MAKMADRQKFIIRTCCNHKTEYVFLSELSFEKYMDECTKVFKMSKDPKKIVKITDDKNAPVTPNTFDLIVQHYGKCACFCLNIEVSAMKDDAILITSKALETFLIDANATSILHESKSTGDLSVSSRRKLVKQLHEYLNETFDEDPTPSEKIAVAKATIYLFPCLKVHESSTGGIDLLINNINGGYLGLKERNSRRSTKRKSDERETEQSIEEDLEFLKSAVVNTQNTDSITKKLKSTLDHRMEMVRNLETDLLEQFPFFFTNPEMESDETVVGSRQLIMKSHSKDCIRTILLDYNLRYKCVINHCNDLVDHWALYSVRLNEMLTAKYSSHIYTQWPKDIQDLLILLKLLPAKNNPKASANLESFNKAIDKLFLFRKAGTARENLIDKSNKAPYIIACGETKDDITHYFIDVDKQLLSIPVEYSAVQTFDIFFKVHKIFDLEYEANIAPMMKFVEHLMYKLPKKSFRPTLRMTEMQNYLTKRTQEN